MCADEGNSNIWTIQYQFETKRKLRSIRYRFTNIGNSAMRIVSVSGIALAVLSLIGAVTAYG